MSLRKLIRKLLGHGAIPKEGDHQRCYEPLDHETMDDEEYLRRFAEKMLCKEIKITGRRATHLPSCDLYMGSIFSAAYTIKVFKPKIKGL